jgi:hypothetical protein
MSQKYINFFNFYKQFLMQKLALDCAWIYMQFKVTLLYG